MAFKAITHRLIRDMTWGRIKTEYVLCKWYDGKLIVPRGWIWTVLNNKWEPESRHYLEVNVRNGDIALDVGACLGHYTLLFSRLVGEHGSVYAFEPDPFMFKILQHNIRLNGLKNVKAFNIALGDFNGTAKFYLTTGGMSSLTPMKGLRSLTDVQVKTLDAFEFPIINWMKVDTEGSEHLVLAGAEKTLARCNTKLLIEFLPQFGNSNSLLQRLEGWNIEGLDHNILCTKKPQKRLVFKRTGHFAFARDEY
jgi:FkbM family methyltransferase